MVVFFPLRNTMASVWPTARYTCPETDALHAHNGLISQGGQCVRVMTQGRPGLDGRLVLVVHAKISWEFAGQGGSHSIALQERENQQVQNEPKYDLMLFPSLFFSSLPSLHSWQPAVTRETHCVTPSFYFPCCILFVPKLSRLVKGGRDTAGYWQCCFGALIPF